MQRSSEWRHGLGRLTSYFPRMVLWSSDFTPNRLSHPRLLVSPKTFWGLCLIFWFHLRLPVSAETFWGLPIPFPDHQRDTQLPLPPFLPWSMHGVTWSPWLKFFSDCPPVLLRISLWFEVHKHRPCNSGPPHWGHGMGTPPQEFMLQWTPNPGKAPKLLWKSNPGLEHHCQKVRHRNMGTSQQGSLFLQKGTSAPCQWWANKWASTCEEGRTHYLSLMQAGYLSPSHWLGQGAHSSQLIWNKQLLGGEGKRRGAGGCQMKQEQSGVTKTSFDKKEIC